MNIAFICVENSCNHNIYSAGLNPQKVIHPLAIKVMKEDGIDISNQYPKSLEDISNVKHLHWGIKDPTNTNYVNIFRGVRDIIKERIKGLLYEIES